MSVKRADLNDCTEVAVNDPVGQAKSAWQTPRLEVLKVDDTAGGITNIPESDAGFLS